ncbi:MAG: hypothetical protein GY857_16925, partial [Desulfobacula sp.]|nr:hypothetical protein [Desulfobacula sp.]
MADKPFISSDMGIILKIVLGFICILVLGFVGLVGYATFSDYKPDLTSLVFENQDVKRITGQKQFNLMIWNIGYAGLSKEMDFFYDGGRQVRTARENVENNITAIGNIIAHEKNIDFFLFQEVDKNSKRSYLINEYLKIANIFPEFHSGFGKNYDVFFVPVPPLKPLGAVLSGLQTLSRFEPASIVR